MKYGARKFVKESYDQNDEFAKQKLKNYIEKQLGHVIISDKENYDHDIISEKCGKKAYWEVEVKHNYPFTSKESFRFDTVSFLGRKKRLHDIKPFNYVIICGETLHAVACYSKNIYDDDYVEEFNINTKHRQGKDKFYRVPKEECFFFNIDI